MWRLRVKTRQDQVAGRGQQRACSPGKGVRSYLPRSKGSLAGLYAASYFEFKCHSELKRQRQEQNGRSANIVLVQAGVQGLHSGADGGERRKTGRLFQEEWFAGWRAGKCFTTGSLGDGEEPHL